MKFPVSLILTFSASLVFFGCATPPAGSPLADAAAMGSPGIREIPVNEIQGNAFIDDEALANVSPENASIRISLDRQRAWLFGGDRLAISTPISTGVSAFPTPTGQFKILQKKLNHESTLYGSYVDAAGKAVLRDVSSRTHAAPPGATWKGTAVPYWQRLTWDGVGMHVGKLPGQPASHGCLRFPSTVMPLIYGKTKIGTPVSVY